MLIQYRPYNISPVQLRNSEELATSEGLPKGPGRRDHIVGLDGATIAGGDPEGEGLAVE